MNNVEVYSSYETPVKWRLSIPAIILTSGIVNNVSLTLKNNPEADVNELSAGTAEFTIKEIPNRVDRILTVSDINVSGGSKTLDFSVDLPDTVQRGYYQGHLVIKNSEGKATDVYDVYVIVDKSTEIYKDNYMDIAGVRAQFADILSSDNHLLESLEVGAGDIAAAVQRCLEQWDSVAPRISHYTGSNFPYTELLRNGTMYMLMQALITYLWRNKMQYSAGGTTVDLEARVQAYMQLKAEYEGLWRSGMMQLKTEENMLSFNGTLVYQ